MNTLYFKYAVEVDRTRSITQAAENLFIAQPNLSKAIKELESTLGFEIFTRTSKGVAPTEKGSAFITRAREIIKQLEEIDRLNSPGGADLLSLNAVIPCAGYISAGVAAFLAELDARSCFDIKICEADPMQAVRDVAAGESSIGVIRCKSEYEGYFQDYMRENGLRCEPLWEFESVLLISRSGRLASAGELTSAALDSCAEITPGGERVPYLQEEREETLNRQKRIMANSRCAQYELLARVEDSYMWTSPEPEEVLTAYSLLQRRCVDGGSKYKDVFVWKREKHCGELEKKLINRIYEAKNRAAFGDIG